MAALDFGMALARGMLPKSEKAQQDLLNLAGGRSVFKSEDWWNKAVDEQISSGYRERERGTEYLMPTGEYQLGNRFESPGMSFTQWLSSGLPMSSPQASSSIQYAAPIGAVSKKEGGFITRSVDVFGKAGREDFTADELSDIESAARRGAEQAKRTVAENKASKRRLSRATGGLMGKARVEGEAPATGLPSLGEGGLGITGSILGGGMKI